MIRMTATPRLDRVIRLPDGRSLAYAEWGDLRGRPVVLLPGAPGSRLLCPDEPATLDAGVRLITIDRPGYGLSDPHPGRTLLGWTADYAALADALELPACPLIGWSSGGPYALACAVAMPDRVTSVGLVASIGPYDAVPGAWDDFPDRAREAAALARRDPVAALEPVRALCRWYADDAESPAAFLTDPRRPDAALRSDAAVMEVLRAWFREGARQGAEGFAEDWIAEGVPWGFDPAGVTKPTLVWWGDADDVTPRAHAGYLAATIPGSRLVVYPGEGHLIPASHWAEMLAALV